MLKGSGTNNGAPLLFLTQPSPKYRSQQLCKFPFPVCCVDLGRLLASRYQHYADLREDAYWQDYHSRGRVLGYH